MLRRRFAPRFDALESRIALATYPAGFIGPIPALEVGGPAPIAISNPVSATLSRVPAGPVILGNGVTENLNISSPGPAVPVATTWSWTVTYRGLQTTPTVNNNGTTTSCLFYAAIPGHYVITAYTTYTSVGWTPYPNPAPTTATDSFDVAPATTATKGGAINTPTPLGATVLVLDTVSSSAGPVGPYVAATAQENAPIVTFYGGGTMELTTGWYPPAGTSGQFSLINGQINDVMGPGPSAVWAATPIGGTYASFTQELRLVWTMTGTPVGSSVLVNHQFTSLLTTLSWSFIKVSPTEWVAK